MGSEATPRKTRVKVGIDLQKLEKAGVPAEVAEGLDPRDGGNITRQGEVLFLDEVRMRSKERPDKPLWRNHPHGLGVKDWLVTGPLATTPATWWRTNLLLRFLFNNLHRLNESGLVAGLFKRLMMEEPAASTYTHGNVMQLKVDVDLSDEARTTVVPYDLLMDMVDRADYIAQMHKCLCRSSGGCADGREDIGCLFLNTPGVIAVEKGIADEVSKEQARAHVLRAMEAGLMGHTLAVHLEQLIWAIPNDKMDEFVEICFCDPEYCAAIKSVRVGGENWRDRFKGTGFTAVLNHDACTECGTCVGKCPQDAIRRYPDGSVIINQDRCFGCGFCKETCPAGAISIKQTMPMRASVEEYFEKEGRIKLSNSCSVELPEAGYSWEAQHRASHRKALAAAALAGAAGLGLALVRRR